MGSIFTTAAGKYCAQVNLGGKRRSKTFDTKIAATRWLRQEEVAHDDGKRKGNTTATFGDLIEAYAAAMDDGKPLDPKRTSALSIIAEHIGRKRVADLDVDAFRAFASSRRNQGAGPATVGGDLTAIGTVLRLAGPLASVPVEQALASLAAVRRVLTSSGGISRPVERKRRPTEEELLKLRSFWAKRRRGIPMWQITLFAIATAMRLGEITRLRWDDLDREKRTIIIRDRKHPRSKQGNDQTVPLLRGHVTVGGELIDPLALIETMTRENAEIFPIDERTISTLFTRAVASCEIDDLRFHDLRHDGVSRLFAAGYTIEQVSLVSGHRDWNMLRRYTQLRAEDLHRD